MWIVPPAAFKISEWRRGACGSFLPNCPYYTICYFAILKAGGTVVNFSPLYVEREIAHQAKDSHSLDGHLGFKASVSESSDSGRND